MFGFIRCEDMVDVRRLKMLQMVQLFKCEEDAAQAVEWLSELLDALLKTHTRLGDDAQETKVLLEKHRKFVDVAQVQNWLSSFSTSSVLK